MLLFLITILLFNILYGFSNIKTKDKNKVYIFKKTFKYILSSKYRIFFYKLILAILYTIMFLSMNLCIKTILNEEMKSLIDTSSKERFVLIFGFIILTILFYFTMVKIIFNRNKSYYIELSEKK